jgi:hypothetical protein
VCGVYVKIKKEYHGYFDDGMRMSDEFLLKKGA